MAAQDAEVEDQGIAAEIPVGRGLGRRDEDAARTFHEILGAEADVAGDRRMIGLHPPAADEIVDRIEPDTVARQMRDHGYHHIRLGAWANLRLLAGERVIFAAMGGLPRNCMHRGALPDGWPCTIEKA